MRRYVDEHEGVELFLPDDVLELDKIHPSTYGMSLVDFAIEEGDRIVLVQVKNPDHPKAQRTQKERYKQGLTSKSLVNKLVPNARDSYTYFHLMKRAEKPFFYVVVLATDLLNDHPELLMEFEDELMSRLRREGNEPWKVPYVQKCLVLTFNRRSHEFPYSFSRITSLES